MGHSNFSLCCQAPDSSSCFSTGDLSARMNLKPDLWKNFAFDCECVCSSAKSTVFRFCYHQIIVCDRRILIDPLSFFLDDIPVDYNPNLPR